MTDNGKTTTIAMNPGDEALRGETAWHQDVELARAHEYFWRERGDEIDVLRVYARTLRRWPKTIVISVILVAGITGVVSKFLLTKWYKASAIIRPISQGAIEEQLMGLMSAFGGGGGTGMGGLLANMTGGNGDADEYVSILTSFAFAQALIRRHNLIDELLPSEKPSLAEFEASRHLRWVAYRNLQGRFTCDYSIKTGNITLEFQDTDPGRAEAVMGYIIDDFRELLRQKQVHEAKAAASSLEEQASRSSDVMLQQELYQLIANQVQREKVAEVQSDFAFTIIDAPSASDIKIWPPTRLLSLLAAFAAFAIVASYILFIRSEPLVSRTPLILHDEMDRSPNSGCDEPPVITNETQHQAC